MRLVLDTDVVVAAFRSPTGASAELLRRVRRGQATLLASVPMIFEYEAVCLRPNQLEAAGATVEEAGMFLDALMSFTEPVEPYFLWRPILRDPNDEMILDAAIAGRADAIVTFNERDFGVHPSDFGIRIEGPRETLARMP